MKMNDDEPHSVEDNAPLGSSASGSFSNSTGLSKKMKAFSYKFKSKKSFLKKKKEREIIKIIVPFDENMKEFLLWDFIYDYEREIYSFETETDWLNRNQIYALEVKESQCDEITKFLKENELLFYLT